MDVDKGIEKECQDYNKHQYHIDNEHCHTFDKRNHAGFAIKPMVCRKEIIKHPDITGKIDRIIYGRGKGIVHKAAHYLPKEEQHQRYQ